MGLLHSQPRPRRGRCSSWAFVAASASLWMTLSACSFVVNENNQTAEPGVVPAVEPGVSPSVEPGVSPSVEPAVEPGVEPNSDGGEPSVSPGVEPDVGPAADAGVDDAGQVVEPEPLPDACDGVASAPVHVLADAFAADIYPLMTREQGGCLSCHASDSGRLLVMGTSGVDSFHRIRTGGFFTLDPGSFFDRVDRDTMPIGGPYWTEAEKAALQNFTCQVLAYDAEHPVSLDEVFPPALEAPYDGPAIDEYDNTFLNYEQLKGRMLQQFGDDWVRDDVDLFTANIALFGGVDFETAFIPARGVTPEFLVGLEALSRDVCATAVAQGTGPFVDVDTAAVTFDEIPSESVSFLPSEYVHVGTDGTERGSPFGTGTHEGHPYLYAWSNGGGRVDFAPPGAGDYRVTVDIRGELAGDDLPVVRIQLGDVSVDIDVAANWNTYEVVLQDVTPGVEPLALMALFMNDFNDPGVADRNVRISTLHVEGPLPGTTGGEVGAKDATLARLQTVFERILLRTPVRDADPTVDEVEPLYTLLRNLEAFNADRQDAYSGVCEALLHHPDFVYTRMPTFDDDATSAEDKARMLLQKTALDLLNRPPTPQEFGRFDLGEVDREALVEEWLASDEFRDAFYHRARILLETDGSADGDEPARLLTWVFTNDRPIRDVLTAEFTVDENFVLQERPAEHGATGVLTMKGYVTGKPGLPHFNYAARVLQGFLGYVFEVPPEAFEARATATAASTVDPTSVCYNCHRVLTPLAYQRLNWDDEGNFRTVDTNGLPIDATDNGLVPDYPFAGDGMGAFAAQAVRKEGFVRRMSNDVFAILMNRPMRHSEDERVLYRAVWDAAASGEGTFKDILRTMLFDDVYTRPVGSR